MSRITLAFGCFFRLLFGGSLPKRAVDYLPEDALPKALPEGPAKAASKGAGKDSAKSEATPAKSEAPKPKRPSKSVAEQQREGSLAMLGLLQREGRLIDFLQESIDEYDDSDIGAAVRDIHRGCKKVLDEHLVIEALMPGEEDDAINVPEGFDPGEIRLVGNVSGEPPFKGILRHHGWRVTETKLPTLSEGIDRKVLAPAQVEVN